MEDTYLVQQSKKNIAEFLNLAFTLTISSNIFELGTTSKGAVVAEVNLPFSVASSEQGLENSNLAFELISVERATALEKDLG